MDRYSRQTILPDFGETAQAKLAASKVVLVGMGALGSTMAELLVRAGVGCLRLLDRDRVELHNLQRCALYDEYDVDRLKVEAAKDALERINSGVEIRAVEGELKPSNIVLGLAGWDLVLDCTDNVMTRKLLNERSIYTAHTERAPRPWIYTAVEGYLGMCMFVEPATGPCLECAFPNLRSDLEGGCDMLGIFGPAVHAIASTSVMLAIKYLIGLPVTPGQIYYSNVWYGDADPMVLIAKDPKCPRCAGTKYDAQQLPFLEGDAWGSSTERLLRRQGPPKSYKCEVK